MFPEDDIKIEELRSIWFSGGSARPLIEALIRAKRMNEAGALARLTLAYEECRDREAIEQLLEKAGSPPPGWTEAVMDFSRNPVPENWDHLMRFTPNEVFYQRTRNTLRLLRRLGTDPNALFLCATRPGTTPDAIELLQSGEVHPDTVLLRAEEAPPAARPLWYGFAAEAAFARGDELGTVRLLKMAYAVAGDIGPEMSVLAIRADASPKLHQMLDKAGIPRME
jgi:hypothetical protein